MGNLKGWKEREKYVVMGSPPYPMADKGVEIKLLSSQSIFGKTAGDQPITEKLESSLISRFLEKNPTSIFLSIYLSWN